MNSVQETQNEVPYEPHQVIIEAKKGWQVLNLRELVEFRDLFQLFVLRDITVLYKQTILGFAWAILNPVLTMLVFATVFGSIGGMKGDGTPYKIWMYAGVVPWTYFSTSLSNSTNSLITSASLLSKVYFPRLIIPLTPVFAKLADFGIALGVLFIMMPFYGLWPSWQLIYAPLLILLMILTAGGIGMWLSALAVQYRDIKFAITFIVQILMFGAPVVWSIVQFDQKITAVHGYWARLVYGLYPMAGVIEGFRASLIGKVPMPWDLIGMGTISAVILFVSGAFYFRRMEKIFADVA